MNGTRGGETERKWGDERGEGREGTGRKKGSNTGVKHRNKNVSEL